MHHAYALKGSPRPVDVLYVTRRAPFRALTALAVAGTAALVGAACQPEGSLDAAMVNVTVSGSTLHIAGWAADQDVPTTPIDVHIYIDGNGFAVRADGYRPDVADAKPGFGPNHGFIANVNVSAGRHEVCAYGINYPGTAGDNVLLGCRTVTVSAPPTTKPPAPSTPSTPAPAGWQDELVSLVNSSRAKAGAGQLTRCAALDRAAQSYAEMLAANSWLDPVGPDGSTPWSRTDAYGGTSSAENLAWGFDTPSAFHSNTLESDGVLAPEFTHIGVGRAVGDPDGSGPLPSSTYWVEELGTGGTC